MAKAAIRIAGLKKRYGDVIALAGMDLEVYEGEIFGLLGPNGAGKTTAVKILTTLLRPDGGRAEVAGLDVSERPDAVRQRIGYVPQEVTADPYLTAREHLGMFADIYHLPRRGREARIGELLRLVGLEDQDTRAARTFSGGMKKKLDLACGLIHQPAILFLDEPSLGLDVHIRREIWDHIGRLKACGTTILLCTNYMDEAERLCERLAIIDRGQIVALGTPADLRAGLGADMITLEVAAGTTAAPMDQFARVAAALPFVKDSRREGTQFRFFVVSNEMALPRVLGVAHEAGVVVSAVSLSRPGLDEVFLRHTGRPFDGAGGGGA